MSIDGYCSELSYVDHVAPIMDALPDDLRGTLFVPHAMARELGGRIAYVRGGHAPNSPHPLITAGYQDLVYGHRPKVLVQHGAGQTYAGVESGSYAGGPGHELADLHIVPRPELCTAELARYPRAKCAAVGAPKLDAWARIPPPANDPPVVAVTFHWNCRIVPEAGWAWPTWRDTIAELARRGAHVLGHCHPRARNELRNWWAQIGVEFITDPAELLARADVLVVDNSSLGFEWAALDRPTVWLDDASWDRDAQHGLRFGEPLPGPRLVPSLANVGELVDAINQSIRWFVLARAEVRARVYGGMVDGHAAERAAVAVLDLIDNPASPMTYEEPRPCNC